MMLHRPLYSRKTSIVRQLALDALDAIWMLTGCCGGLSSLCCLLLYSYDYEIWFYTEECNLTVSAVWLQHLVMWKFTLFVHFYYFTKVSGVEQRQKISTQTEKHFPIRIFFLTSEFIYCQAEMRIYIGLFSIWVVFVKVREVIFLYQILQI